MKNFIQYLFSNKQRRRVISIVTIFYAICFIYLWPSAAIWAPIGMFVATLACFYFFEYKNEP